MKRPVRIVVRAHQPAPVDRHQLRQMPMDVRAVQAFVEILPEDLPVAVHHLGEDMPGRQVLQRPIRQVGRALVEGFRDRVLCALVEIDKHEAAPDRQGDGVERIVGFEESFRQRFRGNAHKVAPQRVGPGMVGAGQKPRLQPASAFAAKLRTAMAAGIVESAQHAGLVAHHQDFLRADPEDAVGQRLGDIGCAADEDPAAIPDRVEIALVFRRIEVGARGQRRFRLAQAVIEIAFRDALLHSELPFDSQRIPGRNVCQFRLSAAKAVGIAQLRQSWRLAVG